MNYISSKTKNMQKANVLMDWDVNRKLQILGKHNWKERVQNLWLENGWSKSTFRNCQNSAAQAAYTVFIDWSVIKFTLNLWDVY